jgi:hypothetical protein
LQEARRYVACTMLEKGTLFDPSPQPRMRLGHLPQLIRRTIGSSKRRLGALSRPLAAEADSQTFKGGLRLPHIRLPMLDE